MKRETLSENISAGSIDSFVDLMNKKAKDLGCRDSHFVTSNGIFDENHYTSAYDMALIAQAFFSNDLLCKMASTANYTIPVSSTVSQEMNVHSKNQLFANKPYAYEYLVGSKTGYTSEARQTLVSCAQKDGLKLICVVMMEESPQQFKDTISLFDYGFSNFSSVTASKEDTTYQVKNGDLFANTFNQSNILSIDPDAKVLLPDTLTFADLDSELSYDNLKNGQAAVIHYSYEGQDLGSAPILFSSITPFDFSAEPVSETESAAIATADGSSKADANSVQSSASNAQSSTDSSGTDGNANASSANGSSGTQGATSAQAGTAASESVASTTSSDRSFHTGGKCSFLKVRKILLAVSIVAVILIVILVIRSILIGHSRKSQSAAIS